MTFKLYTNKAGKRELFLEKHVEDFQMTEYKGWPEVVVHAGMYFGLTDWDVNQADYDETSGMTI